MPKCNGNRDDKEDGYDVNKDGYDNFDDVNDDDLLNVSSVQWIKTGVHK